MKKIKILVFLLLVIMLVLSCNKESSGNAEGFDKASKVEQAKERTPQDIKSAIAEDVPLVEVDMDIFNRSEVETEQAQGELIEANLDFSSTTVNYFEPQEHKEEVESFTLSDDKTPLKIVDFGPIGELPEEMTKPSIYVMFSRPMVPVSKLGEPLKDFKHFTIDPPLEGVFRWYGSKLLSFEVEKPMLSDSEGFSREYHVTLSSGIESLTGQKLEEDHTFSFYTSEVKMVNLFIPGNNGAHLGSNRNIPFDLAYKAVVRFNMPVDIDYIKKGIKVKVGGREVDFTLSSTNDKNKNRNARSIEVNIDKSVTFGNDQKIEVQLIEGAVPRAGTPAKTSTQIFSYTTLRPFRFNHSSASSYAAPSLPKGNRYPTYLSFTQPIDQNQDFTKLISTSLNVDLSENIYVYGSTVQITNLPVEPGDQFSITVLSSLKDAYGQTLSSGNVVTDVKIPEANGYVRFPDKSWGSGSSFRYGYLESYFDPGLIVQHQNLLSLKYGIRNINSIMSGAPAFAPSEADLSKARRNYTNFNFIDLKDSVNSNGSGSVLFRGEATYYGWGSNERTSHDKLFVQVTDIGITVRYGYNKVIVWANSIQDGTPIPNAKVRLYNKNDVVLKTGESDQNGVTVFELKPGEYNNNIFERNKRYFWVAVESDNDLAEFRVRSNQSPYRFGVPGGQVSRAESTINRAMLFSDRQLYKPGEEVSYRGIHWRQKLGEFSPYKGNYSITLRSLGYNGNVIYKDSGSTSESGGFYGTFTLPESIDPGSYYLQYNVGNDYFNAVIKVAFFRRLNFYVTSKVPGRNFYAGDTISIPVRAGYLAGGAMPGAEYNYYWTRKMTGFRPKGERWKYYRFGLGSYTPEKTLDRGQGNLSSSGEAQIKQAAIEHENTAATYRYVLETTVTDIDNQQVASTASVIVHPSSFYIGAKLGKSSSSYWSRFIKAKEKTALQLALVEPDGELYTKGSEVKVEIYKKSWKSSYQQGVYDRVNVSYRQTEELIDTIKTTIDKKGVGYIDLKPEESGNYLLKITSTDKEGRNVQTDLEFYSYGGGWYFWGNSSDRLDLVPDRDLYFVGDKARIMVKSPLKEGKYLLTVEREGIIKESVIDLDENTTTVEIPIEEGYVPRIYVALSSFTTRENAPETYFEKDLGKPKNLFGVTSLNVSNETRTLDVEVVSSEPSYRPGKEAEVFIKVTRDGKPVKGAELIYLAVDRGVIDLVNYHVPNPLKYFYNPGNFALYTTGDDLRNYLMDPVSYDIASLQGGDGVKMEERKDFNPLAAFEPYLKTDANGIAKVTIQLPDTLTTYRSTAIALNGDKIGYSEDEILVKNPINVRSAFPRRLRHRDTGVGDVVLQNNTLEDQEVKITLSSDGISTPGESSKTVTVPGGSVFKVPFLLIPSEFGEFDVTIQVESAVLNERIIEKMIVERPLTKEAFTTTGSVNSPDPNGGDGLYAEEGILIPEAIAPGYGSYNVDLYASRMGMLKSPIRGLKDYYYWTLSEQIYHYMPDAIIGDSITALGFSYNKSGIEKTLKELKNLQTKEGWIKYYSYQIRSNYYIDNLSLLFVVNAKEKGINIPYGLEAGLAKSMLNNLKAEKNRSSQSAFTAYVLNRAGKNVTAQVDDIKNYQDKLGLTGLSYLALTLNEMDRRAEAKKVWKNAKRYIRLGTRTIDINEPYETRWYFDSEIRQISTLAWAALEMKEDSEILQKYINTLEYRFNSYPYRSRTDYLWAIYALKAFWELDNIKSLDMKTRVLLNNKEIADKTITDFNDSELKIELPIFESPLSDLERSKLFPLRIEKEGKGNIYYATQIEYALPSEVALPRDEGISVFLEYETLDGEKVEPDEIAEGTTYRIRAVVSSDRRRSYLTLDVPVPSGMEIVDPSFATTASYRDEGGTESETWTRETVYGDEYEFDGEGYGYYDAYFGDFWWYWKNEPDQKIYDNHLTYSWDTFYEGKRELTFLARSTSRGIYPTPPAQAYLLFEPEVFGRSKGSLFVIK